MFNKTLAAVKKYCMPAYGARRIMSIIVAVIAFAAFIHAVPAHILLIKNYY
ncbi:MAG: hypothetical protein QXS49_01820 [Ferroplasma sp.]|jgi:hypothetical protein